MDKYRCLRKIISYYRGLYNVEERNPISFMNQYLQTAKSVAIDATERDIISSVNQYLQTAMSVAIDAAERDPISSMKQYLLYSKKYK